MGSPFYVHLTSLAKHDVFEPIVQTLLVLNPLDKYGYFLEDNEKNEVIRHKARLIVYGFPQRSSIENSEDVFTSYACNYVRSNFLNIMH